MDLDCFGGLLGEGGGEGGRGRASKSFQNASKTFEKEAYKRLSMPPQGAFWRCRRISLRRGELFGGALRRGRIWCSPSEAQVFKDPSSWTWTVLGVFWVRGGGGGFQNPFKKLQNPFKTLQKPLSKLEEAYKRLSMPPQGAFWRCRRISLRRGELFGGALRRGRIGCSPQKLTYLRILRRGLGMAWHSMAWHIIVWLGMAWRGLASHGIGMVRDDMVWHGMA